MSRSSSPKYTLTPDQVWGELSILSGTLKGTRYPNRFRELRRERRRRSKEDQGTERIKYLIKNVFRYLHTADCI
jgi:hypothetical protein